VTTSDINSTEMDCLQFFSCNSSPLVSPSWVQMPASELLNRPNLEFLEGQQSMILSLLNCFVLMNYDYDSKKVQEIKVAISIERNTILSICYSYI